MTTIGEILGEHEVAQGDEIMDGLAARTAEAYTFLESYDGTFEFLLDVKRKAAGDGLLSERQVDAVLRCKRRDEQRASQRAARPASTRREITVTEGMYRTSDGTIFKVQKAVNGSGRLYAKRLIAPNSYAQNARFEYAPGAVFDLTVDDRMTLEQAREFGALYGTCCVCGRTLTNEVSIERGIGPICEGRGRWAE